MINIVHRSKNIFFWWGIRWHVCPHTSMSITELCSPRRDGFRSKWIRINNIKEELENHFPQKCCSRWMKDQKEDRRAILEGRGKHPQRLPVDRSIVGLRWMGDSLCSSLTGEVLRLESWLLLFESDVILRLSLHGVGALGLFSDEEECNIWFELNCISDFWDKILGKERTASFSSMSNGRWRKLFLLFILGFGLESGFAILARGNRIRIRLSWVELSGVELGCLIAN